MHVFLHVKTSETRVKTFSVKCDVGIEVQKSKQGAACKQREGMIACNNNNMCNPISLCLQVYTCTKRGYASYYCCMLL